MALEFQDFLQAHVEWRRANTRRGLRRWLTLAPAVLLCLLAGPFAHAASSVDVDIHGVDDELRDNVLGLPELRAL